MKKIMILAKNAKCHYHSIGKPAIIQLIFVLRKSEKQDITDSVQKEEKAFTELEEQTRYVFGDFLMRYIYYKCPS